MTIGALAKHRTLAQTTRDTPSQRKGAMRVTAAVLYDVRKPVVVEDVELLEPGPHEVQVRWAANGVCHSDLHVITGDSPHPLPVVLGHEAAGVVEKVGPGVETVAPGDHVCSSYIPSCGKCWYCIGGQPTMCALRDKPRWFMFDGTPRFKKDGRGLHHYLQVAGYATHSVLPEESVIPIRKDAPLDVVCLVSCGVLAGAGRSSTVQGPAGRERGGLRLRRRRPQYDPGRAPRGSRKDHRGGRHEAEARVGRGIRRDARRGRLAGGTGARVHALSGRGASTSRSRWSELSGRWSRRCSRPIAAAPAWSSASRQRHAALDRSALLLQQRVLTGSSFGGGHQRTDVPMLIDLYMSGKYKLDELISRRLPLGELNRAFDLMLQGEVKRSVIVYS